MAQALIRSSLPNSLIASGGDAFTLAVAKDASVSWRLRILAKFAHGTRYVGTVITQPYNLSGAPQARVIAAGSMPSALGWEVQGQCLSNVGASRDITLDLTLGVSGQNANFQDLETRTVKFVQGAAGTIAVDHWQRVLSLTARAANLGATVQFGTAAAMAIPANEPLNLGGNRPWGEDVIFTGTDFYLVELEG